ncbi:hypothetical protein L6164_014797 [Bauhinia variegata]|uniref:Uncharacterized protein n=1 Tax=Bauhinia variegata TaxID=167791 RepID=A0ACB9NIN0_BAUVA|nr:hypothetical protein L6164_014797 [Bauhinia variegata]
METHATTLSNSIFESTAHPPDLLSLSRETVKHRCIASLKTLTPHITCLAFRLHENLLYAASLNLINVFDLSHSQNKLIDAFNDDPNAGFVKSIAFHDSKIFTAHQDCKIRAWLITPSRKHRLLFTLPTIKDCLRRFILPQNYVKVRRHKRKLWIQHSDTVSGLVVNQTLMYSVSWDKSLKIWDVADNYRCLESVKAHEDAINAVAVSDEGTVYTASADGCIRVWERDDKLRRYALERTLEKQKSTVNALALNGDGKLLFSGGCDGVITVWERKVNDGSENDMVSCEKLWGHVGAILCLINVEGVLASGSADQTVRVWQWQHDGANASARVGYCCKAVLKGHEKPIKSLAAYSSNGVVTIFSGSLDGYIKVWDLCCLA